MIPLFKTNYSIGKSILTVKQSKDDSGPDSVFSIAKEHGMDRVVFVEDSLVGFLETFNTAKKEEIDFVYGLRLNCSATDDKECQHKVVVFAKNDNGCKLLNKIYSESFCNHEGILPFSKLKELWSENDLKLTIPFYDSFLCNNVLQFHSCVLDFDFTNPTFFVEDNKLPFDHLIYDKVKSYCDRFSYKIEKAKSIYYKHKEDFDAYLTYKIVCNRQPGRQRSLQVPNFSHMGSDEFSFESYLNNLEG